MANKKLHDKRKSLKSKREASNDSKTVLAIGVLLLVVVGYLGFNLTHQKSIEKVMGDRIIADNDDRHNNNDHRYTDKSTATPTKTYTVTVSPSLTTTLTVTQTTYVTPNVTTTPAITETQSDNGQTNYTYIPTNTPAPISNIRQYIQTIFHPTTVTQAPVRTATPPPTKSISAPTVTSPKNNGNTIIINTNYGSNVIKYSNVSSTSSNTNQIGSSVVLQSILFSNEKFDKILSETSDDNLNVQLKSLIENQKLEQSVIQEQISKIENRNTLLTIMLGPDYKVLNTLQSEINKTEENIAKLQQLKESLTDQPSIDLVSQTVLAMQDQARILNFYTTIKMSTTGLLGKYLNKP
jgi:hypothetical protein